MRVQVRFRRPASARNVRGQQLVSEEDPQRASTLDRDHRRHQWDAPRLRAFAFERRASLHVVARNLLDLAEPRNESCALASTDRQITSWSFDFDQLGIL